MALRSFAEGLLQLPAIQLEVLVNDYKIDVEEAGGG